MRQHMHFIGCSRNQFRNYSNIVTVCLQNEEWSWETPAGEPWNAPKRKWMLWLWRSGGIHRVRVRLAPSDVFNPTLSVFPLSQALQSVGNLGLQLGHGKEQWMTPLHPIILCSVASVKDFLDKLIDIDHDSGESPRIAITTEPERGIY